MADLAAMTLPVLATTTRTSSMRRTTPTPRGRVPHLSPPSPTTTLKIMCWRLARRNQPRPKSRKSQRKRQTTPMIQNLMRKKARTQMRTPTSTQTIARTARRRPRGTSGRRALQKLPLLTVKSQEQHNLNQRQLQRSPHQLRNRLPPSPA